MHNDIMSRHQPIGWGRNPTSMAIGHDVVRLHWQRAWWGGTIHGLHVSHKLHHTNIQWFSILMWEHV